MITKMKLDNLVKVKWLDSAAFHCDADHEDYAPFVEAGGAGVTTVGIVRQVSRKAIAVAQTVFENETERSVVVIPRGCITGIWILAAVQEARI
jgi:hypothetical protein